MTEIVQILPTRRFRFGWTHALILGACLAGPAIPFMVTPSEAGPSAEFVQPDIADLPTYVLVGTGCGEKNEILLAYDEDGFPPSGCQNIEVHEVASGYGSAPVTPTDHPGEMDA